MKKQIRNDSILYTIAWSQLYKYDKYQVRKVLPGLPGIISLYKKEKGRLINLVYVGCWRDGCRQGMTRLFNPEITNQMHIYESLKDLDLYYKYTIVDTTPRDMQDILHWLINTHENDYNDHKSYKNSGRFKNVVVDEREMGKGDIVEKIYKTYH